MRSEWWVSELKQEPTMPRLEGEQFLKELTKDHHCQLERMNEAG